MIEPFLNELAWQIEASGLSAAEDEVGVVVSAARVTAASPVLIAVLADRTAPEAVRGRAFGRLALHLARCLAVDGAPPVERPERAPEVMSEL